MKKLLLILAVGAFVACNNSGTTESTIDSASKTTVDSPSVASDSLAHATDTVKPDSTKK
jgi:hypothetical protein